MAQKEIVLSIKLEAGDAIQQIKELAVNTGELKDRKKLLNDEIKAEEKALKDLQKLQAQGVNVEKQVTSHHGDRLGGLATSYEGQALGTLNHEISQQICALCGGRSSDGCTVLTGECGELGFPEGDNSFTCRGAIDSDLIHARANKTRCRVTGLRDGC